jgi:hypothetical protein
MANNDQDWLLLLPTERELRELITADKDGTGEIDRHGANDLGLFLTGVDKTYRDLRVQAGARAGSGIVPEIAPEDIFASGILAGLAIVRKRLHYPEN